MKSTPSSIRQAVAPMLLTLVLVACQRPQPQVIMGPIVDTKGYWYRVKPKAPLRWMPAPTAATPVPVPAGVPGPTVQVVPADLGPPVSPEERKRQIKKKLEDVNTTIYNLRQGLNPTTGANLPSKAQGNILPSGRQDRPTETDKPPPAIPLPAEPGPQP